MIRNCQDFEPFYANPNTRGEIGLEFSFAYQPIVDAQDRRIVSYEALVRGPRGEPSASVFAQVPRNIFPRFDELCRRKAIHLASCLKIPGRLNLNITASSIHDADMNITSTFLASVQSGIPVEKIIFEVTESESLLDHYNLFKYLQTTRDFGFKTAMDDFGAGHSGLTLLVQYQPDFVKLAQGLIRDIHNDHIKQTVFEGIRQILGKLSIEMVAEGVETAGEYHWLENAGVRFFQGYYFARPAFEALPDVANFSV